MKKRPQSLLAKELQSVWEARKVADATRPACWTYSEDGIKNYFPYFDDDGGDVEIR